MIEISDDVLMAVAPAHIAAAIVLERLESGLSPEGASLRSRISPVSLKKAAKREIYRLADELRKSPEALRNIIAHA